MKCFVAVLFLVAVAAGEHCTPPEKYSAKYFVGNALDAGSHMVIKGEMMVDMAGKRLWETFNVAKDSGPETGEVLILYNEDKMYVTSNGHCVEMKIPEQQKDTMDHLILPEDAKLLQSGNIADSNLRVNLYGGVIEKEGHQVTYIVSQTDESCILVSATYMVANVLTGKVSLFDVRMEIDEGKFVPPKDCYKPPPQASAAAPSYRLFR